MRAPTLPGTLPTTYTPPRSPNPPACAAAPRRHVLAGCAARLRAPGPPQIYGPRSVPHSSCDHHLSAVHSYPQRDGLAADGARADLLPAGHAALVPAVEDDRFASVPAHRAQQLTLRHGLHAGAQHAHATARHGTVSGPLGIAFCRPRPQRQQQRGCRLIGFGLQSSGTAAPVGLGSIQIRKGVRTCTPQMLRKLACTCTSAVVTVHMARRAATGP